MMWIEEIDCPNVNFFTSGEVTQAGVIEAYKYLAESYRGVFDFIGMLDLIFEGVYTISEVIMAGVLLIDAVDGYLVMTDKGYSRMRGKYLRINDLDTVFIESEEMILCGKILSGTTFDADNGPNFKMHTRKISSSQAASVRKEW